MGTRRIFSEERTARLLDGFRIGHGTACTASRRPATSTLPVHQAAIAVPASLSGATKRARIPRPRPPPPRSPRLCLDACPCRMLPTSCASSRRRSACRRRESWRGWLLGLASTTIERPHWISVRPSSCRQVARQNPLRASVAPCHLSVDAHGPPRSGAHQDLEEMRNRHEVRHAQSIVAVRPRSGGDLRGGQGEGPVSEEHGFTWFS